MVYDHRQALPLHRVRYSHEEKWLIHKWFTWLGQTFDASVVLLCLRFSALSAQLACLLAWQWVLLWYIRSCLLCADREAENDAVSVVLLLMQ